jgi:hypothetical protein
MNRFIRSPQQCKNHRGQNHMKKGVFTQPGSFATFSIPPGDVGYFFQSDHISNLLQRSLST